MSLLQVLLYSSTVGRAGLGFFPITLQAPQSDPPSWTPKGYSSNSCFEVLYIVQNVRRCYTPSRGSWKVGFCWMCVPARRQLSRPALQQMRGRGASVSLFAPRPSPPMRHHQIGGGCQYSVGIWGGWGAGVSRKDVVPALSRALAAGTVLQWVIRILEYCFCCPGKAGNPTGAHPPGKSWCSSG